MIHDLPSSMKKSLPVLFACLLCWAPGVRAQSAAAGEAEAQKCAERIAAVRRDTMGKYADALAELQSSVQKAADLEGALAGRKERSRVAAEQSLADKDYVVEPKVLRQLQTQTSVRLQDLLTQLVSETVPKLVELKRHITVSGKLDEAVSVRTAIETLQNSYLPAVKIENGAVVAPDTLVAAYTADRARADKIYKGQKIVVRGVVGGFRPDPNEPKNYHIFVTGGASGGWLQCTFHGSDHKFREEKGSYNVPILVISAKDGDVARIQKGAALDLRGTCDGWDESVRLSHCDFVR